MISLGLYIANSKNQKAFVGDTIKLDLAVQDWMINEFYTITDIRPDGTVILNNCIGQHICGIKDFSIKLQ